MTEFFEVLFALHSCVPLAELSTAERLVILVAFAF